MNEQKTMTEMTDAELLAKFEERAVTPTDRAASRPSITRTEAGEWLLQQLKKRRRPDSWEREVALAIQRECAAEVEHAEAILQLKVLLELFGIDDFELRRGRGLYSKYWGGKDGEPNSEWTEAAEQHATFNQRET